MTEKINLPSQIRYEIGRERPIEYEGEHPHPLVIDFGTTKSILAYGDDGNYEFVKDRKGKICVPSTVRVYDDGVYEVGVSHFADNTFTYSKRDFLRQGVDTANSEEKLLPDHTAYLIIRSLIRNFEEATRLKARSCILSIPCDYNVLDVSRIVACAQATGIRVVRVLPEPTAAALNLLEEFGTQSDHGKGERCFVVVDMGGGTLDIAFARLNFATFSMSEGEMRQFDSGTIGGAEIQMLATAGEAKLGGIDFNSELRSHILKKIDREYEIDESEFSGNLYNELEREVERAKLELSVQKKTKIFLTDVVDKNGQVIDIELEIDRKLYEKLANDLIEKFKRCVESCVEHGILWDDTSDDTTNELINRHKKFDLSFDTKHVDTVLIAGQSGKIPIFKKHAATRFPNATLVDEYSDIAVARGMAIWQYMTTTPTYIDDIAHSYIGFSGLRREENWLKICRDDTQVQVVYPTDRIPLYIKKNVTWPADKKSEFAVTTNTVGKDPQNICKVIIDPELFNGNAGFIEVSIDRMSTVVVGVCDHSGNGVWWQINNFFRIPTGFFADAEIKNNEFIRKVSPL